ncbi:Carbon monoxide dehydrogenase medium chain [[Actinomadura] parvosata subsp. kistnae]|uniref:Carbon monoxide dehydrogenase n=1 Tax=[Actinomadura] parvosata subsp. kistnae TaxID=1909395 RepID=A0A1V0A2N5_9ACTN|nr:xanthine dehydrogenase family protein subunit M [Nonomuraea sp. ATCC 55076]AQZ64453.1 carbon monoxide dehydrogenase [Nonomuraea sp. ATCC 55076]SPL89252.1 Carbon monoxide dehydrogenase medium chain [Actinomadura parvosata subsp. kistnae]
MQVPATFAYERADSVPHALELLERYGPEARVVAGGHSLIPMMKLRLAQPEALIDINGLAGELGRIAVEGDELAIGAMVRHTELLESVTATDLFPIFRDAERVIADPIVRNRGTVGGSLCQGDPSEDLAAVFAALRATAVVQGPGGVRTVPVRRFHQGPYETAVAPNELLIQLRVPVAAGTGSAYEKVERRAGDWPVAAAGAVLRIEGGTIVQAGIGLTAVGAPHFCAPEAETYLEGREPGEEAFAEAGRIAAEGCAPHADQRGPADYKRHLAAELTRRALVRAAGRS